MNTFAATETDTASFLFQSHERSRGEGRAEAHYQAAREAIRKGDFATAASESLASAILRVHHPAAHYLAGMALLKLGLVDEAEEALLEAVRQAPVFPEAHHGLAILYHKHRLDFFRMGEHQQLAAKTAGLIGEGRAEPVLR